MSFRKGIPRQRRSQLRSHAVIKSTRRLIGVLAVILCCLLASASPVSAASPALGVYVGAANPSGVAAFGSATGTHTTIASDYVPGNSWSAIADPTWLLKAWQSTSYHLVLGVPIIPVNANGDVLGTLAEGAAGKYNQYFVDLAQNLVQYGERDTTIRLGWEFNGNWFAWAVANTNDAVNFAAYYREIVDAMRSVNGQEFTFVWDGAGGPGYGEDYTVAQSYPGNGYVDYIGQDVYDTPWTSAPTEPGVWEHITLPLLTTVSAFAERVDKPMVIPEWGVASAKAHGLGDDAYWLTQMVKWIKSQNVSWASYFNFDDSQGSFALTDGEFPNSLAAFRAGLSGASSGRDWLSVPAASAPAVSHPETSQLDAAAPEFPVVILLPLAAIAVFAIYAMRRRKTRGLTAAQRVDGPSAPCPSPSEANNHVTV